MSSDGKGIEALRRLLTEAHRKLGLKLGFSLWDGSRVPADWPAGGLMIAIRDAGVVAALLRKPKLDTLLHLYIADRIAIENGSIFDLAAARPDGKIGRLARGISKAAAFDVVRHFIFAPGQAQAAVTHRRGDEIARDGDPATNKANVAYHYDVSNAFYRLFLDEEMVYTCAYFTEDHGDIGRAQRDKLDMICRKLRLKPGDKLLDIGCGWGALICHAAQHYGVEAHGVTLAEEQLKFAQEKVDRLGLSGKVTLHLKDFTQMEGEFDKISSIGMFEQVGIRNHPTYFQAVNRLLKPRGLYLHHTISRRAKKTEKAFNKMPAEYRALVRYIFPGGELDHLGMSIANLERHGFEVHDVEGWREHYQRTTRLWWEKLNANKAQAEAEIGPERTRMWLIYLAGCSLAFERGGALVNQTLVSKRRKGPSGLPLTRADLYR
ncbi:class I SAM-dependent methyltransferase [Bosea sp. (in: a-proteobacteria)]|jgi:cyclopropane-fatty-acyl-phospholipid synthase|uniref:class I SAM-dependent methyltransferase n=1 Tax=Bosea sp. (in: a-proteobacteria) TaxID=1871050 RepID=UPI002DDCBB19|nr:class I SAM-dependent methyltransferase [Bosea sp. (in: a-proteobacteria)]HEV2510218.1 class I SAM-dependent methyltransferase [Bosea sp. (in: a-proteobacteria)]